MDCYPIIVHKGKGRKFLKGRGIIDLKMKIDSLENIYYNIKIISRNKVIN
jgi:hypothetical protein